jgi:hypothetical protein
MYNCQFKKPTPVSTSCSITYLCLLLLHFLTLLPALRTLCCCRRPPLCS